MWCALRKESIVQGRWNGKQVVALSAFVLLLTAGLVPAGAEEAAAPPPAAAPAPSATPVASNTPAPVATPPSTSTAAIADDMVVRMEYQLHTEDGTLVDSTQGKAPFEYTQGRGQIIPGLERQLAGLHAGDQKEITVKPEEGYGPVNPLATEEVERSQLPKDVVPQAGMVLRGTDPDGRVFRALIKEVKEKVVVLDLNHPLAGKTLTFQVTIVDVHPATATP